MVRHPGEEAPQPGGTGKWIDTAEGWARSNVLYDKADRPPKAGSLREALFLSVWLRRQEIEIHRERVLAQGLADVVGALGAKSSVIDAFTKYVDTVFPFNKQVKTDMDTKMKEVMERQVKKGALTFTPIAMDFLKKKTKTLSLPDDFQRKLRQRGRKA